MKPKTERKTTDAYKTNRKEKSSTRNPRDGLGDSKRTRGVLS